MNVPAGIQDPQKNTCDSKVQKSLFAVEINKK